LPVVMAVKSVRGPGSGARRHLRRRDPPARRLQRVDGHRPVPPLHRYRLPAHRRPVRRHRTGWPALGY